MARATERSTRLSCYALDRCGLNALVRLGLAVRVERRDGRVGVRLTPGGAALLGARLNAPAPHPGAVPCSRRACGGVQA